MEVKMTNEFLIKPFRKAYQKHDHAFFDKGDYNVNLGGIRCANRKANSFDDLRYAVYKEKGVWRFFWAIQTTDPGLTGLKKPCRPEGCAILVPGQYRGAYKIGFHKTEGRYALVQRKKVAVYRDWNKDNILDMDPKSIMWGKFGINVHDPWKEGEEVNARSLGCQVSKYKKCHKEFMQICTIAVQKWGEALTYTLLDEADFA
jgi:hypothetical protein